jgi:hypothetical protein
MVVSLCVLWHFSAISAVKGFWKELATTAQLFLPDIQLLAQTRTCSEFSTIFCETPADQLGSFL